MIFGEGIDKRNPVMTGFALASAFGIMPSALAEPVKQTNAVIESEPQQSLEASDDSYAELARELQNPVANLISVPIQNNWDFGIGPTGAMRYLVNVQPVIPFSISSDSVANPFTTGKITNGMCL